MTRAGRACRRGTARDLRSGLPQPGNACDIPWVTLHAEAKTDVHVDSRCAGDIGLHAQAIAHLDVRPYRPCSSLQSMPCMLSWLPARHQPLR